MRRVLLLEPDADVAQLLVRVCATFGLEPVVGGDLSDADVAAIEVDLVVVDPSLWRGVEIASTLSRRSAGVDVVVVTASASAAPVLAGLDVKATLTKPFSLAALRAALAGECRIA